MEYDPNGNVLSVTDRDGKITRSTYDPRNRTVTTIQNAATQPEDDPVDVVTTYEYDQASNLLKITDAEGKQTQYEFDNAGRRTKTIYAANSSTQPDQPGPGPRVYDYTYHPNGQLASVIKPNGVRIEYAYENRELLAARTYSTSQPDEWQPLGEDTFTYHANGLLATAHGGLYNTNVDRNAENLADYDAANRLLSERQNIGAGAKTFTYTYTNDSLPDTVVYPGGAQVQQTYTNRRQMYAVNLAAPGEQQLIPQAWHEYDAAGRLTMRHRANNTETLWEYDANSRTTHIAHQAAQGGQIFQSWAYVYTDAGNPLAQKDTTPNLSAWGEAYRYDQMNRLIDAKRGPVDANNNVPVLDILLRQQWDLTKVGNWEQWTKSQQGEQDVIETREHNDLHSLTSRTIDQDPAKNLAYDANGNQIDDGEQFLLEYDANDQLCRVRNRVNNAIVAEYRYDVFGRRIEKDVKAGNPKGAPIGVTRYYYTDQQIAEERDGNDVVQAFYTYGHYIDEPLTMDRWNGDTFTCHFYHQNRMFSTYVLTDSQGAVVERHAYNAYGECTTYDANYANSASFSRLGNPYTFTGRELDAETRLMHYRSRLFSSDQGRFTQTDLLDMSLNLYEYVDSSPTTFVDPTGLAGDDIKLINSLVQKYKLSPAGRRALHDALRSMKATGETVSKAAAEAEARTIASLAGKYVIRGLGIVFIVLTLENTAQAPEIPPLTLEDVAKKIAKDEKEKECIDCLCQKFKYWRKDAYYFSSETVRSWLFWTKHVEGWYPDIPNSDRGPDWKVHSQLLEEKSLGRMTVKECKVKCEALEPRKSRIETQMVDQTHKVVTSGYTEWTMKE